MAKIKDSFIKRQYQSGVQSYADFTKDVGLWKSELYVFQHYLKETDCILDVGCGTGRTAFPLYKLGYRNIVGVDFTPEMIREAILLNNFFNLDVKFEVGDARDLRFSDHQFDSVIFSFNGIMSIPGKQNRDRALVEIHRVLKERGIFIFTTHDRNKAPEFFEFWKDEKLRWKKGTQRSEIYEFGDVIAKSKNETRDIFIHIPDMQEVEQALKKCDFEVVETFYRSDIFNESEAVKEKSGECRFWVARKIRMTST